MPPALAIPNWAGPGVLHGAYTYLLQDEDGQVALTHSISAGLDYAAVGPEHSYLRETGRAQYTYASDEQALAAFQRLALTEGILPALESAHAIAEAIQRAPQMRSDQVLLVNLSGRGDKDLDTVIRSIEWNAGGGWIMSGLEHIAQTFANLRKPGRAALMPYFTLGYPTPATSLEIIAALACSGADLIELGIPFSDPLADGPTIQHSTQVALEQGMTVRRCLDAVAQLRAAVLNSRSC